MNTDPLPAAPPYGARTLAEVVPSLLSAVGGAGFPNALGLEPADRAVVLLVDGLGWDLLERHCADAPFLSTLATEEPLHAGFPATTATSLTTLGTGLPPAQHGMVGYTFHVPGHGLLNTLSWRSRPGGVDLREAVPPERVQRHPTLAERAAAEGRRMTVTMPREHDGSGLTRAAFRGARVDGVFAAGDLVADLASVEPGEVRYGYHGDLDGLGHYYGPGSPAWRRQLTLVDRMVQALAEELPPGSLLAVVADHGMVAVTDRVDVDEHPVLREGVEVVGGEVRVRHLYVRPGAAAHVRAAWSELLGDRAWVCGRDEALAAGWFGPAVDDAVRPLVGDVVVALRGGSGVVVGSAEPLESDLLGQHGSLERAEQLVPLLLART